MPYSPQPPTSLQTLDELRGWLENELRNIALAVNETQIINLRPSSRAPDRVRDGMIINADNVGLILGAGPGAYERKGGAWVKL
jgi:hypothetical protein